MSVNTEEDRARLSPSIWKSKSKSKKDSETHHKDLLAKKVCGQRIVILIFGTKSAIKIKEI